MHVRDTFTAQLFDDKDQEILDFQDYPPDWVPGKRADSVVLEVDNETGRILNWKPITEDDILDELDGQNEYDGSDEEEDGEEDEEGW